MAQVSKAFARHLKPLASRGPVDTREPRSSFLIVCEGEQTEPNYFRAFRVPGRLVVIGAGANTKSLVDATIEHMQAEEFDRVWCVMDRDSFDPNQFNGALARAAASGIEVAYSNEAFEIWYLMHFNYYDTGMSRDQYKAKLSEALGERYQKNSRRMYDLLLSKQADAIRNAKRLLESYTPRKPLLDNPSTTVHLLVLELNQNTAN